MFLSDQQARAASFGSRTPASYEWVEPPVGPQPLPAWAKGLHVRWTEGYANPPSVILKTEGNVIQWPGKAWSRSGDRYMAVHEDGRGHAYYHRGEVSPTELTRWQGERLEPYTVLATTPSDGLAGNHIHCLIADGEHAGQTIVLRGPWCGATPEGYVDTPFVDTTHRSFGYGNRRWHERGGLAGLLIAEDLFLRLFARFAPECRCARVTMYGASRLEPVRGDWDEPKAWMLERERSARQAARAS